MNEASATVLSEPRIGATAPPLAVSRPPLRAIRVLLPVWGYKFVRQFLEFCLPTLLAPGNVPALVEALPCEFVLMTSDADAPTIRGHPAWRSLSRICDTKLMPIDDLITDGNHSATITLAYARAVRETGDDMLDTCFLFLVSDYVVAAGSLGNVVARIRDGASAVLAGNFQIVAEDAIPLLRHRVNPSSPYIHLPPRELVGWSLAHLHPATVANIVNFGLNHNAHTNRLFWCVDERTLIGRFYLMHMIAIRPEVTDFIIGASCDYSFVPEMCPSGSVSVLTDSDEYLVVEMQPRDHENRHLRWGPIDPKDLADSLSEWTTTQHRKNVDNVLLYHAAEVPPNLDEVMAQSDAFLSRVNGQLAPTPQPHRHHHYWIGSIAAHRAATRQALSRQDWKFLLGQTPDRRGGLVGMVWRLRFALFGRPPQVTRLHPRWPDYRLPLAALQRFTPSNGQILVVAEQPIGFAHWLASVAKDVFSIETGRLLEMSRRQYLPMVGGFDTCMLILTEKDLNRGDELVERIGPLLKPGGHSMILVTNDRGLDDAAGFGLSFAYHAPRFLHLGTSVAETHYVPSDRRRWQIQRTIGRLGRAAFRRPILFPLAAAAGGVLAIGSFLSNQSSMRTEPTPPRRGLCSSVFMILRTSAASMERPLPRFRHERDLRPMRQIPPEAEYERYLTLRDELGLEPLGLRMNQVWHDDPRQLGSLLARYKFIAKLLSERHDVGEYGCTDAFGTRIVLQEVKKATVYDPNPIFIEDVQRRYREEWPLDSDVHEILTGPLPRTHDSIYSLDVLQTISPEDEAAYVRNLRDSLSRDYDILIVGTPSYEGMRSKWQDVFPRGSEGEDHVGMGASGRPAGEVAAPRSAGFFARSSETKLGGRYIVNEITGARIYAEEPQPEPRPKLRRSIYPRTGGELKALLERYFHTVFLFSMIDEVVQGGITPAAQYVFAVCCGKKV
ncbi:MAG: hypothetical protein JO273_15990 [Methylobacteriaceae bacterium]|nr:hypothetical protein [Methylobacteriaceae bacterium]